MSIELVDTNLSSGLRKKFNLPDGWRWYAAEVVRAESRRVRSDDDWVKITGAVAPPKLRGKSKGQPNWRKMDRTTKRDVFVQIGEYDKMWKSA